MDKEIQINTAAGISSRQNLISFIEQIIPNGSVYHPEVTVCSTRVQINFEAYNIKGDLEHISHDRNNPSRLKEHAIRWFAVPLHVTVHNGKMTIYQVEKPIDQLALMESYELSQDEAELVSELNEDCEDVIKALRSNKNKICEIAGELLNAVKDDDKTTETVKMS